MPACPTTRGFRTARRTLGNAVFYSFPAAPSAGSSNTADHASRHAAGPREPGTAQHGGSTRRTARAIGLPSAIILFLLVKREVDKNRLEQLHIRRKMLGANVGDYETERYRRDA
eukprot:XP_025008331.1 uncharacterized protein LOC112532802 [Gallus gallus]